MSRKTLRMNHFGESILSEFDVFYIWVTKIQPAYPETANKPDINKVNFNWHWNGYNGIGEIYYLNNTKTVCNVIGENSSNMTVLASSKKQQPNGRSNCALYNDDSLEKLFNRILNMIDLSNLEK
jgi:hypothetical protein